MQDIKYRMQQVESSTSTLEKSLQFEENKGAEKNDKINKLRQE